MRELKPVTVKEFIEFLQCLPQDLLVAYKCCSEQCLLEKDDISILEAGEPRPDGWIQNSRPDKPNQRYVLLPGN